VSHTLRNRRWSSQPPRVYTPLEAWAKHMVAWTDQQDRADDPISPIVEVVIDNNTNFLNTNVQCRHGLEQRVFGATVPNVHWLLCGSKHTGVGMGAGSGVSVIHTDGNVTRNTIELRFFATAMTVNVSNPLTYYLYFFPFVERLPQ